MHCLVAVLAALGPSVPAYTHFQVTPTAFLHLFFCFRFFYLFRLADLISTNNNLPLGFSDTNKEDH